MTADSTTSSATPEGQGERRPKCSCGARNKSTAHARWNTVIAVAGVIFAIGSGVYSLWANSRTVNAEVLGRLYLADSHLREGDVRAAREEVAQALTRKPSSALGWVYFGRVVAEGGDDSSAVALYRDAIDLDPNLQPAHFFLGRSLATMADNAIRENRSDDGERLAREASHHLVRAQDLLSQASPSSLDVPQEAVLVERGFLSLYLGMLDEAMGFCSEAKKIKSDYSEAYLCAGHVYLKDQDPVAATTEFRTAVRNAPRDPRVLATAGSAALQDGDLNLAERLLVRSLRLQHNRSTEEVLLKVIWEQEDLERYRRLEKLSGEGMEIVDHM